jgi:hypothetical protein
MGGKPAMGDTAQFDDTGTRDSVVDERFVGITLDIRSNWRRTISVQNTLVTAGNSQWAGGTIDMVGTWENQGQLELLSDQVRLVGTGGTLLNNGTFTQKEHLFILGRSLTLYNAAGALWDLQTDRNGSGIALRIPGSTFTNAGTFQKSKGTGVSFLSTIAFSNCGLLAVQTGTLALTGAFPNFVGTTLTGGAYIITGALRFTGANIATLAADLVMDGTNSAITDLAGGDALPNFAAITTTGHFTIQNGRNFTTAGDFSNAGTLTIGAGSIFTVNGNYIQDPAGTLEIELGGTADTGAFGQLMVAGNAALAGMLTLTLVNDYTPTTGDAFPIMTFMSRNGTAFDTPPDGFDLTYADGNGVLTVTAQ